MRKETVRIEIVVHAKQAAAYNEPQRNIILVHTCGVSLSTPNSASQVQYTEYEKR